MKGVHKKEKNRQKAANRCVVQSNFVQQVHTGERQMSHFYLFILVKGATKNKDENKIQTERNEKTRAASARPAVRARV